MTVVAVFTGLHAATDHLPTWLGLTVFVIGGLGILAVVLVTTDGGNTREPRN